MFLFIGRKKLMEKEVGLSRAVHLNMSGDITFSVKVEGLGFVVIPEIQTE